MHQLVVLALVAAGAVTDSQQAGPDETAEPAVRRGLAWLAKTQHADGAFGSEYGDHVAVTGLACMAFMAGGHLPGRGQYGQAVEHGMQFVLGHQAESGLFAAGVSRGPMYGHAFATVFLAELYGNVRRQDLREALQRAVRLIVATQNDEGGWRYQPVRADADLSVTVCQVMALRAARNAGIEVPKGTIDRAIEYIRASQEPDGGFRYLLESRGSAFGRSAGAVAALYYAGVEDAAMLQRGLQYLMGYLPGQAEVEGHYFYSHYYAIQAMWRAGGAYWQRWWPAIRDELLGMQDAEGFWSGEAGREYGTAMALIILQVPKGLLPILDK